MKTFQQPEPDDVRAHPWTVTTSDPACRYWNFRENPALIRTSVEDLVPWSGWPAAETAFRLLEWLNGTESLFESNDFALSAPAENDGRYSRKALEVTGRVMILWRDLARNLRREDIEWLERALHLHLNENDTRFDSGVVGITIFRTAFVTLPLPEEERNGHQLILSFWAWGDSVEEAMTNLDRTLRDLFEALRAASDAARRSSARQKR